MFIRSCGTDPFRPEAARLTRGGLLCAAVLALSGCLGEGTEGAFGFLSDRAAGTGTAPAEAARSAPGKDLPKRVDLAGGKVVVAPPRGYCVDPRSLRKGLTGGFALIASCNSLTGDYSGADVEPVLMTVQVQPGLLTRDLPGADDMATAMAPARALRKVDGDGLTLVQLDRGGDKELPAGDPRHWRGAMLINGYLVGLALYAPKGSALAGSNGQRLILQLAENLLDASPIPNYAGQAAALKKQ